MDGCFPGGFSSSRGTKDCTAILMFTAWGYRLTQNHGSLGFHLNLGSSAIKKRDLVPKMTSWWLSHPSEKDEFVSWDDEIPNIWKNKIHVPKCSKPPIRWNLWTMNEDKWSVCENEQQPDLAANLRYPLQLFLTTNVKATVHQLLPNHTRYIPLKWKNMGNQSVECQKNGTLW